MSEVVPATDSTALVLPATGEVVDLTDERQVAKALNEVQVLKVKLLEADRRLREAMAERSRILGTKTLHIDGVGKVEVSKSSETIFPDVEAVETALRAKGMPEERIAQIIVETVQRRVSITELKRAAAANPDYAEVMATLSEEREKIPTVTFT